MNSAKVVTSNCILGYVSKTDYTCIFDKNGQYNVVEDVKFLSMINILYRFSPYTLENYYHNFSKKICEYDEIIVKQNQLIELLNRTMIVDFQRMYYSLPIYQNNLKNLI